MTSLTKKLSPQSRRAKSTPRRDGHWVLQDAKARFSELVRLVRSEGPQHITVHGRDEVVVIALEDFQRLQGARTGQALVDVLRAAPHPDVDIAPRRVAMPVREVSL